MKVGKVIQILGALLVSVFFCGFSCNEFSSEVKNNLAQLNQQYEGMSEETPEDRCAKVKIKAKMEECLKGADNARAQVCIAWASTFLLKVGQECNPQNSENPPPPSSSKLR
jgi:hypothetical protein